MKRRGLAGAAGVLLAAAAGVRLLGGAPEPARSLMGELVHTRPDRAFAARLSIPMTYQHCVVPADAAAAQVPREVCGDAADPPVDLEAFAAARASVDADSLHASALADVIWPDRSEPTAHAVLLRLEKALRLSRRPVPLLVDLSAVYLVRAERMQDPRDLMKGLDLAYEALVSDPRNAAALFNTALALQAFGVDGEAARAWDRYLAVDSNSAWAREARERQRAVISRPALPPRPVPGAAPAQVRAYVDSAPQEARLLGWDVVLGEWGNAVAKGDRVAAAAHLAVAESLGAALEQRGGDASLADAVRVIRRAEGDPRATAALARGHGQYAVAQEHYHATRYEDAGAALSRLLHAPPPSPTLVTWARVFHAATLGYAGETDLARPELRGVLSTIDTSRHPAVEARARWVLGTQLSRIDSAAPARAEYRRAGAIYERLGETEHHATILNLDGGLAHDQGDALAGYKAMHGALRALRHYRGSLRLHNQLVDLADRASLDGMPWAGSILLDEAVAVAARFGEPLVILEARLARADLRAVLGDHRGAARDLDSIAPLLPLLEDQDAKDWTAARLGYTRVVVTSGTKPPEPAVMDSAVEYFRGAGNLAWLVPTLLRRADIRMAAGDGAGATADLEAATGYIRNASGAQRDAMLRSAVMERARSRFDQLVMLHLRDERPDDALRALENGRTSFASAPQRHAPLRAPDGEVAVEYALIGDTLLIWTVGGGGLHLVRDTVDRGEFLLTVEEVGAALESPAGDARAVAGLTRLYGWLMRPVRERLGEAETPLVILADGEIARVPFAALVDSASKPSGRARGRYLVQDHPLRFAATLSDARRTLPNASPGRALLVADPEFSRTVHPTLEYLRGAREEVDSLKKLYPDHVPLERAHATRSAVTAEATSAQVIHYAGHAVFNDARPERSMLVLAGPDTTARLTAEAFHRMRLPNVRLVVLSACGTLRSRDGRSGGFAGFSGALLAAGAGGVVGSLWDVNDERTRHLMWAFHAEYVGSGNAAAALREAQLKMLSDRDPGLSSPSTWAAFRYAGR